MTKKKEIINFYIWNHPHLKKLGKKCLISNVTHIFHLMIAVKRILLPKGKNTLKHIFLSGMQLPFFVENSRQISTSSSCQNLSKHLDSFDFFFFLLILRRLRRDPEKTFWNGPELAVWLFGNPPFFLSLFYNLIKSALCFATFLALISGLGRVKRLRQFEKGSLHHKEAACSQLFPSSTPPRQKGEGESKRVIHWLDIVRT